LATILPSSGPRTRLLLFLSAPYSYLSATPTLMIH
jgi:hypothetical protein